MGDERGRSFERRSHAYSRWTDKEKVMVPGMPLFVPDALGEEELEAVLLRFRIDEIGYKLAQNQIDTELRGRSPSPTPVYDNMGRRLNTREQRAKDKLMAERQRLVERAKVVSPSYRPPLDYRPFSTKKIRKIYVPVKEYPDYNFIGLILGPRGFTQRQMEQETGAKISLRGKGSVRDGKGRSATKDNNEDDDLHVVISGDSEEALDHAEALVRRLLVPVEEGKNDIKRKQLRKLAELNGTLKDNNYGFEREQREGRGSGGGNGPSIQCRWCGETSHPSSDCTFRGERGPHGGPPSSAAAAAGGGGGAGGGPKLVTKEYYDLMVSLGEDVSGMSVIGNNAGNNGNNGNNGEKEEGFSAFLASVGVVEGQSHGGGGGGGGGGGHYPGGGHHPGGGRPYGGGPPPPYGYPSNDFHQGQGGGGGAGRYGGNNNFHNQPGNQQQYPPPPQGAPSDDIPPWEREEARGGGSGGGGSGNFSADAPAPWDM